MKVIFLGSPKFGEICLRHINESKHEVVCVVTQADKANLRGGKSKFNEVKTFALNNNLPLEQFEKINKQGVEILKAYNADIMVTAAYGQIISQKVIDVCKHSVINVHGSLLPKYRGASPIQSAIINGDKTTGITIMQTELSMDTGDVILQEECQIEEEDTYLTLADKLAEVGGKLVVEALNEIENGTAKFVPQNHSAATHTKMFKKEDTKICFNKTAQEIVNLVRGLNPNPYAYFEHNEINFLVLKAKVANYESEKTFINGEIVVANGKKGLIVACSDGFVEIVEIKPQSSKQMLAKSYLNGKTMEVGSVING